MRTEKKINERLSADMHHPGDISRRGFMKRFGGGLVIAFSVNELNILAGESLAPQADMNAYLHIAGDGRVTLFTGKIEMGQGPITSLPMMLADELDVKLSDVDIIQGDTALCPWDEGTYGSLTTRVFGQQMRRAAAKARSILLLMAAEKLGAQVDQLSVKDGVISAKNDVQKSVTYAELTSGKSILEKSTGDAPLKKSAGFTIMGTSRTHVDAHDKVTGKAKYSGDIQLPGMLHARIVRPPSLGAKLVTVDTSAAEKMEGVLVVRDGDLVAVLHPLKDTVDVAIAKVKADYKENLPDVNNKTIYEYLLKHASQSKELAGEGDPGTAGKTASKTFQSEYKDPYIAHAPMENHTATAVMEDGVMKIWASCQTPYPTRDDIAEELGMPKDKVRMMPISLGGGFGGKIYNPQAIEAAKLAKLTGKPVQVVYPREEEFLFDRLRPAAVIKIDSGLDSTGKISYWDYHLYFGGDRGARQFYEIPSHRTTAHFPDRGEPGHPFYTGAWRAPSNNTNTFARESQIDIMAAASGADPVEFRLNHLRKDRKMTEVLQKGAEKFGWPHKSSTGGKHGVGVACGKDAGTDVAVFVEVEINESTGQIKVLRALSSQNMGLVVNPQGAIIQAEGCIIMGLGYALSEEVKFEGTNMLTRNFDSYSFTHFSWIPEEIDVLLIDARDDPPQGGGEPAIICMGGAVANAVYDALGVRIYQLPLTPQRILDALKTKNG